MRYEIKYIVTDEQRRLIEQIMRDYMIPDAYGESTICNVYFDTPDHRLVRHSLEKPIYKEKLRVRSYGQVMQEDKVYLELKKKFDGVVYKRRISLTAREVKDYLDGKMVLSTLSQIGNEIEYFRKLYQVLIPTMYISYKRSPYCSNENSNLRITFDQNIMCRETELCLTAKPGGQSLLKDGYSLMEIKTAGGIPLWLTNVLTENSLVKTSFSKYGNAYQETCRAASLGGIHCA